MSISTPPPPVRPKKKGMGCLGCGCLILALLVLLVLGLVAGASYLGYRNVLNLTSTTPSALPAVASTDDLYNSAKQKIADFDHDVKNHQAATVQLSPDEINALIARDPTVQKYNIRSYVSFTSDQGRVQMSLPTELLSSGIVRGRYVNLDTSFGINFDPPTRSIILNFHTLQLGDKVLMSPDAPSSSFNTSFTNAFTPAFNQSFNKGVRQNPDGAALLNQAKSIEIKDGELVIETQ
jgi:hypothetical protein